MNKILFGIIFLLVIVGIVTYFYNLNEDDMSYSFTGEIFTLMCQAGPAMSYTYADSSSTVLKLTVAEEEYTLKQERAASGIKYENNDGSVMFWEHQGEASLEIKGSSYTNCTILSKDADEPTFGAEENWLNYSNKELTDDWQFTLKIPPEVTSESSQTGIYSFKYIGPDSEPNTEITDGFLLTLTAENDTTVSDYIEAEGEISAKSETTFNGYDATTYSTISELDNSKIPHTVFQLGSSTVIDITEVHYGTKSPEYKDVSGRIFDTLIFTEQKNDNSDLIKIDQPTDGDLISSPVKVSGQARGYWFFEATAPVKIIDMNGLALGEGWIEAEDSWMTENFVPFSGEISYELEQNPSSATGTIVFMRANPSGLLEKEEKVEINVQLEKNTN